MAQSRRTKIIATLGPATDRPGMLAKVIEAGADVIRLNLSHGTAEDQLRRAEELRRVATSLGVEVAILADLQGPKIRIERFADGAIELEPEQPFILDCADQPAPGTTHRVGVSYKRLCQDVYAGDTLLLDDGLLSLKVERIDGLEIHTRVQIGGRLSDRKGINRLGGGLSVDALSDKDRRDIELAARMGADYLAVSFPRTAADMNQARALLRGAGSSAALVAKIERAEAMDNLGEIIDASDAVLVARGDLGVEIGYAELPGLQKRIIRESLSRHRVVITATQMLQSMVDSPIPTRAEVLDVANAVLDGSDAVMLSAETASGKHPDKAVAAMRSICEAAERQFGAMETSLPIPPEIHRPDQAIAMAAMTLANRIGVRAIVALTESGATAQWLSRFRSHIPIYAMSRHQGSRQRMNLYRDVYPVAFDPQGGAVTHTTRLAVELLHAQGRLSAGDRVIVTTGDHTGLLGGTNTMKLLRVGADGTPEGMGDL
ncbi:MAG: pyruvate kinase [Rhodanobacteraceae bacterium]|nr:pyruvate kinase [Rhodanobacteraceae bacterium]